MREGVQIRGRPARGDLEGISAAGRPCIKLWLQPRAYPPLRAGLFRAHTRAMMSKITDPLVLPVAVAAGAVAARTDLAFTNLEITAGDVAGDVRSAALRVGEAASLAALAFALVAAVALLALVRELFG